MTISSEDFALPAWSLLLSKRQEVLDNHLAPVPTTAKQRATNEMREEFLASAGAQDMDTSGYGQSDLEDIEFF